MSLPRLAAAGLAGYLAGSIPAADIASAVAARLQGNYVDIRSVGSRNPGALNVAKSLGRSWGAAVIVVDIAKGWAGSVAGRSLAADNGAYMAGFTTVLGHCFPVWTNFRGGKGMATSAGACLACFPAYFPADLAIAGLALAGVRFQTDKATYIESAIFALAALVWYLRDWPNGPGPKVTRGLPLWAAATTALIYIRFLTAPPVIPEALRPLPLPPDGGMALSAEQRGEEGL
jgi:acyl phosphate:glycerol-3-phosphate acyltransferase